MSKLFEENPIIDWDSVPEELQHFKGSPTGMSIDQGIVDWYVSLDPIRQEKLLAELNKSNQNLAMINRDEAEGIKRTWNKEAYDPLKDYYFMDYKDNEEFRWVRNSLMTWEDVVDYMSYLGSEPEGRFSDLRIQPEKLLSRPHDNIEFKDSLVKSLVGDDDGVTPSEITERTYQFGLFYDLHHQGITGIPSLGKQSSESKGEWLIRVKKAQEEEKE